ncbi:class D sortase [Paenibacillus frigoriresistens]|uniref:class D sortase n=1 Tax=Paenibacillus alginolyticus TaxID=59839 RepID=UPI001564F53B|nr:class D sortase [Paenibacillus frigoriresistens]NRF94716.1 class D sortase [Paenibacillus frigoriresistens]
MIRKKLSLLFIVLGIIIFLYPTLNDHYESYQQNKILKQWQENLLNMDQTASDIEEETNAGLVAPSSSPEVEALPASSSPSSQPSSQPSPLAAEMIPKPVSLPQKNIEGVLTIDKINLKLPILTDATVNNLKISVASIAKTGKVGAVGNYAIAGHRNLTYGKNFNRLDEVTEGDFIEVNTGSKTYIYKVVDKQYVLPEDVWVLKGNGKDREITLITCHPMENPTHRIAIKGILVQSKE